MGKSIQASNARLKLYNEDTFSYVNLDIVGGDLVYRGGANHQSKR